MNHIGKKLLVNNKFRLQKKYSTSDVVWYRKKVSDMVCEVSLSGSLCFISTHHGSDITTKSYLARGIRIESNDEFDFLVDRFHILGLFFQPHTNAISS